MTAAGVDNPATMTAEELADRYAVKVRTVRYWIRRGLPAAKVGTPPRWRIDPTTAGPWIAAHARGAMPRVAGLVHALEASGTPDGEPTNGLAGPASMDGLASELDRKHIERLDKLLDGFTELLFSADDFDPRLVASVKAISTELRRRETHLLEMRKADAALMDRADHARILGTFARLVVDEIQAWQRTAGDAVIDTLTAGGVKIQAKRIAKALDLTLDEKAIELRERIVEGIEQAGDIE